ncbi:transcriptional regulator [Nocardia sp. NPDC047648]|uniref:MmyB family transcriptional regulator n=1 Tax=Nocardia sp. NPDC047648 TaxID=3155625 RepID=UPI0033D3A60D
MTPRCEGFQRDGWEILAQCVPQALNMAGVPCPRRARDPGNIGDKCSGWRRGHVGPVERQHLYRLARPWSEGDRADAPQRVRPGLRRLLDSAADVPAYIVGRNTDVLAWNRLAAALITDFGALPPAQRNLARLVFLDEGMRSLYADWPEKTRDVAAYLRLDAGRHPEDPETAALLDELSAASPEFRQAWAEHQLKDKTHGRYVYRHPVVGELDLGFETLRLPDDPDQALMAHTVEEGSPSQTALRLLASWAEETRPVT